jgi:hypothetical protein
MREELAAGPVAPAELDRALTAAFLAAEAAPPGDLRARVREEMPRTTEHLGRLFTLESLSTAPAPGGGVLVDFETTLQADAFAAHAPRYGPYLKKYSTPLRVTASAEDAGGVRFWEAALADNRASLRLRVHGGGLAPLEGPPRPMPRELVVRVDASTRMGMFNVGLKDLVSDVTRTGGADDKRLVAAFRRRPDWQLPFLIEPFLAGSLRRPFEGEGSTLSYALEARPGSYTLLVREFRIVVKESWIVRWLGGLMSGAVSEFRRGAEAEADRYHGEVLLALRDDAVALMARGDRD